MALVEVARRDSETYEDTENFANSDLEEVLLNIAMGSFLPNSQSPLAALGLDTIRHGICEAVVSAFWGARSKVGLVTPRRLLRAKADVPVPEFSDAQLAKAPPIAKRRRLLFSHPLRPPFPEPFSKRQNTSFSSRHVTFSMCRSSSQLMRSDPFLRLQDFEFDTALSG
mmetsp:Transcript_43845/g.103229  ORF Transcript_43845/g.103229 Transcript_43845/m.103229 type:complete len:168 (+) Transcript_43845:185-688(+)|eukprot:CAMPEP_0177701208 /NCGR_PEP_ID=MMETSP0484_2-20121128/6495_1 /TAXON_ID=354590 /ORGANISM="Rhodomonas lens, Strain RHODO" /LENGTH=167 /DNA_ID=CAMNT_0019212439 /DNA_START=180 /DNA_END=683 /DNA_ORIENTATION=+